MTIAYDTQLDATAAAPMSELEKTMIRDNARAFAQNECPPALVRAAESGDWTAARATWPLLAELGWLELLVDEDSAAAMGLPAICVIAEELGRAAYPLPFAETATLALPLLNRFGSPEQRRDYLPGLIAGTLKAAIALPLAGLPERRQDLPRWPFDADTPALIAGHLDDADLLLIPVDTGDAPALALLPRPDAGWSGEALPDMANSSWTLLHSAELDSTGASLIGAGELDDAALASTFDRYRLATAAFIVGLSAQALDLAVDYAKERIAFGKPIGTLQAVQQRLAESALEVAAARLLYQEASIDNAPGLVAASCVQVAEAGKKATFTAQQVWGGMGFTLEVDVQLYFRRARACQLLLGHPWEAQTRAWCHLVPR